MSNEPILEQLMYVLWCSKYGYKPSTCKSIDEWRKFQNIDAKIHCGDCTKDPCPCLRCNYQSLEVEAQNALNYFEEDNKEMWKKILELRQRR